MGFGSAMYHMAYQLTDRFGVVVANDKTMPELVRKIKSMGCYDRMVSMIPLNIPIEEAYKDEIESKFVEIGRYQIDEQGANLIAAGHATMLATIGFGSRERIEQKLGVPVLEPPGIAIKTLETLVDLKLSHSKKAYPSPTE